MWVIMDAIQHGRLPPVFRRETVATKLLELLDGKPGVLHFKQTWHNFCLQDISADTSRRVLSRDGDQI